LKKPLATVTLAASCIAVVALTALAARALDSLLTERMVEMKSTAMRELEAMVGRPITYARISPSFFRYIEVRDLTIHDAHDPDKPLLTINTVRIYYSLFRLLAGRDTASVLREISLLNTRFNLDLDRDRDVADFLIRLVGPAGAGGSGMHVRVTGRNIGLSFASGGFEAAMDGMFFQIEALSTGINVTVRGNCTGRLPDGFTFSAPLTAQGSLDRSLTAADLTMRLQSFTSSLVNTGTQTVQIVWKDDRVDIRKIHDRSPIAMDLLVDLKKQDVALDFRIEGMRLDRLASFSPRLARFSTWLTVPLTASGRVEYHVPTKGLDYDVTASARFADQLPIHDVTLDASILGTEKEAFLRPLRLSLAEGRMEFYGNILFADFSPEGLLTLDNVQAGTGEKVSANLALNRAHGRIEAQGTHMEVGQIGFDSFFLSLSPRENGASFTVSMSFEGARQEDLLQAEGEINFGQSLGALVSSGSVLSLTAPVVSVSAALRNVPPDRIYHLLLGAGPLSADQQDLYNLLSHLSVSSSLVLTTNFSSISVESKRVSVVNVDDPGTTFHFDFVTDATHVSVSDFSGTWKSYGVQGGFEGDFGQGGSVAFTSDFTLLGTPYTLKGRYSADEGLSANGSYGVALSVVSSPAGGFTVRLKTDNLPLPLYGHPLYVSFDGSGFVTKEGEWSADLGSVILHDIPFLESTRNTLQFDARVMARRVDITRLSFTDAFSRLTGTASADIVLPDDISDPHLLKKIGIKGQAALKNADGTEAYSAYGELSAGVLSLKGQFAHTPIARLGKSVVTGSLSGTAGMDGPLDAPGYTLAVSLNDGRLGTDALSLGGELVIRPEAITVKAFTFGYLSHRLYGGAGLINRKKGTYSFNAGYQGEFFADRVRVDLALEGGYSPEAGSLLEGDPSGKMSLSGISVADTAFPAWSVSYRTQEKRISFEGGPGKSLHGWIDSGLAFNATLTEPLPFTATVAGSITGDRISASVDVDSFDLLVINSILRTASVGTVVGQRPVFQVTAGFATGSVAINGPVNDPDFSGSLDVVGGGVSSAYSIDEAGPIKATFVFDGKRFHAEQTGVAVGAARMGVKASVGLDHWSPLGWEVALETEGKTPPRLRARFGRLIAEGSGAGNVTISGNDRKTAVTGSLTVSDCRITLGDYTGGKFVPEDPPTYVDLAIAMGKRVEFYWPSMAVPVLRTTASAGGKIDVTYRGDTGAYTVKGASGVQGGEIYYYDRSFIMKRGTITFDEDQTDFDPWINVRAEVREWDPDSGEEVKVFLDADSPLSKFSPRFSAEPSRTEAVIMSMIGAPILNRAESQGIALPAFVYSDFVTQSLILRPFEQKVRQILNLDMFSLHTQIIQNLVAQKVLNSSVNPLDNTSLSLGKYLGNDLFLEMLVSLQQQDLTSGGLADIGAGLEPDLELSLEWSTPFFLLEWSFLPKHPENMFLSDNSLSFSWRFSY
jgi:translocation and assembly module TamB